MKKILILNALLICAFAFIIISCDNSTNSQKSKQKSESIEGTYSFSDNSVRVDISIHGNTWRQTMIIVTGIGADYDRQNAVYYNGIVKGNKLYDDSGFVEVGFVRGNFANIIISGKRVSLKKKVN